MDRLSSLTSNVGAQNGCLPLLDSLRSSLIPGWPLFRPPVTLADVLAAQHPALAVAPSTMSGSTSSNSMTDSSPSKSSTLPPGLNPLSIAAITGDFSMPSNSSRSSEEISKNNNVKSANSKDEEEDIEDDSDKDSDRTEPATECTTPSSLSLSSPTRFGQPSPGGDGRRQSEGSKSQAGLNKKRVTCDMCGKSYCDKGALKIHTSAVHLKEMQMCTVPGCTKEFTSRRSRNRHSKNKNMKLHTSDPAKLAQITAIQEQSRVFSGALFGQTMPVKESRKRKSTDVGVLDLTLHSDTPPSRTAPPSTSSSQLPVTPFIPGMQWAMLQQMVHAQLLQNQAAAFAAAASAATSTASSTTVSQLSPRSS